MVFGGLPCHFYLVLCDCLVFYRYLYFVVKNKDKCHKDKNLIIATYLKGFQSKEEWCFPFWNIFFLFLRDI